MENSSMFFIIDSGKPITHAKIGTNTLGINIARCASSSSSHQRACVSSNSSNQQFDRGGPCHKTYRSLSLSRARSLYTVVQSSNVPPSLQSGNKGQAYQSSLAVLGPTLQQSQSQAHAQSQSQSQSQSQAHAHAHAHNIARMARGGGEDVERKENNVSISNSIGDGGCSTYFTPKRTLKHETTRSKPSHVHNDEKSYVRGCQVDYQ